MPVSVEGPIVDLLVDIAHHGSPIPSPAFPDVAGGDWAGFDLGKYPGRLVLGDKLTLFLEAPPGGLFGPLHKLMDVRNEPAVVNLADGSRLEAELAHMRRLGAEGEVDLHHWAWRGSELPEFWVGKLDAQAPEFGNLVITEKGNGWMTSGNDGYFLEGRYAWYLVPGRDGDPYTVVVDLGGAALDREALIWDILAMEFSFGRPLRLDMLVGIDRSRHCVAAMSVEHYARPSGKVRSPVPDYIAEADTWIPRLFMRVARKLHSEGLEPFIIPFASYLDSIADHLDGGYLKAHVGLEAFANRLVGGGQPELLVKHEGAWRSWLKSLRPTIESHLVHPNKLDMVLGKFISAKYAPTGDVVRRATMDRGIKLPKDVLDEVRRRNYTAHGFLMNAGLEHDIDRDVRRLEMIQTVLAALVALHVGYDGPLRGYDVDDGGKRPNPSWWPTVQKADDVAIRHLAERFSDEPSPPR